MATAATLGPVVVGVDGSAVSDRALDWASDYASLTHRRLVVAHGTGFVGARANAEDVIEAERVAMASARVIVDALVDRATRRHPGLGAVGIVDASDALTILLEEGRAAALLVVGSRHDETFKRLFGSVSLGVARHATCPVVVVRPPDHRGTEPVVDRIVLGVDGTEASVDAAAFAFEYASLSQLPLLIVHGSWERLSRGSSVLGLLAEGDERGLSEEEELSIAETIAGLPERYPEVDVRETHRTADPAEALIEASETAKLVVVGARRMGAVKAAVLRSVSTALVQHAHSPVAVVHSAARAPVS